MGSTGHYILLHYYKQLLHKITLLQNTPKKIPDEYLQSRSMGQRSKFQTQETRSDKTFALNMRIIVLCYRMWRNVVLYSCTAHNSCIVSNTALNMLHCSCAKYATMEKLNSGVQV